MSDEPVVERMRERITDEIFFALGFNKHGFVRRIFGRLFYLPTNRFAQLFAAADEEVGANGLSSGSRMLINGFGVQVHAHGMENIPVSGPLLLVSNHPGAYDSIAIGSRLARPDLKIIVYEVPFYRVLPHTSKRFIYATDDTAGRMLALRDAIEHLQSGGALLQFGTGTIDPDPAVMPGSEIALESWNPSLEIMLRKAPATQLVLVIASGVVLRRFAYHPLTRIHRKPVGQRRLAEVLQIIQQLIKPASIKINAHLSFSSPVSVAQMEKEAGSNHLMPAITRRAQQLLQEHQAFRKNSQV